MFRDEGCSVGWGDLKNRRSVRVVQGDDGARVGAAARGLRKAHRRPWWGSGTAHARDHAAAIAIASATSASSRVFACRVVSRRAAPRRAARACVRPRLGLTDSRLLPPSPRRVIFPRQMVRSGSDLLSASAIFLNQVSPTSGGPPQPGPALSSRPVSRRACVCVCVCVCKRGRKDRARCVALLHNCPPDGPFRNEQVAAAALPLAVRAPVPPIVFRTGRVLARIV
ncbi:Protein of unknown function [Gryllus bimaculatus]|nr:Protein of unknown function [Gryllus bimaculatus]